MKRRIRFTLERDGPRPIVRGPYPTFANDKWGFSVPDCQITSLHFTWRTPLNTIEFHFKIDPAQWNLKMNPLSLEHDFVVMDPGKNASIEHLDSGLYGRLDDNYKQFVGHELISCYEFTSDWSSWEMHPNGDEVVLLMAGTVTFVLEAPEGEKEVELSEPGQYLIVPRGTWHTAKTATKAKVLFITPGEGTQHRNL